MRSIQRQIELQTYAIQQGIALPFFGLSSHHKEKERRALEQERQRLKHRNAGTVR